MRSIWLRQRRQWFAVLVVCSAGLAVPTWGEELSFAVTWSGADFGNAASASGFITIEDTVLLNPGTNDTSVNPFVTEFTMIVSDAASGNGTFVLGSFDRVLLTTGALPLDFGQELLGQDTGADPWGTQGGGGGDFNVFSSIPGVPQGAFHFEFCTDGGLGDCLLLTSFRPAVANSAWLKLKVKTKGMEFLDDTLLGKAKAKGTCYWHLTWFDSAPAGGTYYCETTPGVWVPSAGGSFLASNPKDRLFAGSCGLMTATGTLGGPGFFSSTWKAEADGALKSAKLRTVGGYLSGTLDGVNTYLGDCKIVGSSVPESKVPAELLAIIP